ncbi:MAG TPA: tetratricopeptide repeat protein, partial [Nitrospirae bacterium]|nr:tetratricopeptide repeat protein [Nitrospirota bacterium]
MRTYKKRLQTFAVFSVLCVVLFSACVTTPKKENNDQRKAEAHYKLGYAYLTDNRLKKAYVEFQTVLNLEPRNKQALNALGLITSSPGFKEYKEAVKYFNRAISIDPNYSEAMNNLGAAYVNMGKWDEGIKYFRRALKNPVYAEPESAYYNIAYAQYMKGDYAGAVITLKGTISRYPEFPGSYYVLGLVYIKQGRSRTR